MCPSGGSSNQPEQRAANRISLRLGIESAHRETRSPAWSGVAGRKSELSSRAGGRAVHEPWPQGHLRRCRRGELRSGGELNLGAEYGVSVFAGRADRESGSPREAGLRRRPALLCTTQQSDESGLDFRASQHQKVSCSNASGRGFNTGHAQHQRCSRDLSEPNRRGQTLK